MCNVVVVFWITDWSLTSRPEMGAPLGPGWAALAAFLGQTWLHHYWEVETTRQGQHYFPQEQILSAVGSFIQRLVEKKIKYEYFPDLSQKLNVWNNGGKKTIFFKRGMNLDGLDVILFQRQGAVHLRTVAKTLTVENRKSDRNTKD